MMIPSYIFLATAIYAIIGGPSAGKTSIINELKNSGEITVEEAATVHILQCQNNGDKEPWLKDGFQKSIFNLQIEFENKALTKNPKSIFCDRGLLDSLVYLKVMQKENTEEYKHIKDSIDSKNIKDYYKKIFYVEPYIKESFVLSKSAVRRESTEEALNIGAAIKSIYEQYFTVINVPGNLSPKERAEFILSHISSKN